MKDKNKAATLAAIGGAAIAPFVLHPALTFATRRAETVWPFLEQPNIATALDISLPVVSTLVGFALLARLVNRPKWLVGLVYIPVTLVAVLYMALMVFGYAWRDFP